MAGKYGSQSVLFLVDGYNLVTSKLKALRYKHEAMQERTDGLGDAWEESTPIGLSKVELAQDGAFFDTTLNRIHTAMVGLSSQTPASVARVVCAAFAGNTLGNPMTGFEGAFTTQYDVLAEIGKLTKANAAYAVSGALDHGIILQELATKTEDWNNASVDDNGGSSSSGGVGYLQVSASFGAFTGKIQHSTDNVSWADLVAFSTVTASPDAERKTVSGTVNRYLRFIGAVWGDASLSLSPSSSLSPSASISPTASASPSRSPSSSVSPSMSASGSISPSASASASLSPSASVSPSSSTSASPSPSAEAGIYGTVTVFCGFTRG